MFQRVYRGQIAGAKKRIKQFYLYSTQYSAHTPNITRVEYKIAQVIKFITV